MKTRIFVIRHGQTTHNIEKIISGHVNPPLTETGRKQVEAAREKLSHINFDAVYSSDTQRAADTAEIILGKPVIGENRLIGLRERNFGSLDGHPEEKLEPGKQEQMALTLEERWHFKYADDAESDHELGSRFISTIEEIARANEGKTILIAAHGGSIRIMLLMLQNLTHNDLPPGAGTVKNAGYVELAYTDEGLEVIEVNTAPDDV